MMGFVILFLQELIAGKGVLEQCAQRPRFRAQERKSLPRGRLAPWARQASADELIPQKGFLFLTYTSGSLTR